MGEAIAMRKVSAWHCSYCQYYRVSKKSVEAHEKICFYNPETKSCASCYNLISDECLAGVEFDGSKLKTQCNKYLNREQ